MVDKKAIQKANYILRDFMDGHCSTFLVGPVSMYFYAETLIGVRHEEERTAFFLELPMKEEEMKLRPPMLEQITQADIDACINDLDPTGETMYRTHSLDEIQDIAKRLVVQEVNA